MHRTTAGFTASPVLNEEIVKKRPLVFRHYAGIHPFLFAAIPLLSLYVSNIQLLKLSEVSEYLLGIWVAVLVIYLIARGLFKDHKRAGILTTVVVVACSYYGAFYDRVNSFQGLTELLQSHVYSLTVWLIIFLGIAIFIVTRKFELQSATNYLNYFSIILVLVVAIPGIFQANPNPGDSGSDYPSPDLSFFKKPSERILSPDVYYIILDAHARSDTLRQYYGFDDSHFIQALKERGFYIASEARSNYPQTAMSMVSSLNMNYLDALGILDARLSQSAKISRSTKLWDQPVVAKYFEELGYATSTFKFQGNFAGGELPSMFMNTTIGRALFPTFAMRLHRSELLDIFENLAKTPEDKKRTFVYAHILAPHPPFIFSRDGSFTGVTGYTKDNAWFPPNQFIDQLYFVEQRTLEVVDAILVKSESRPIIVIQGDHGTFSTGMKTRETLPILNAYLLPPDSENKLYPSISPVNTFRLIFNTCFGADFDLLPDQSYVAPALNEYDSLCKADDIFPDDTEPKVWKENVTKAIKEHNYRLSVVTDCDFQKLILMNDTFQLPETFEGERFRWAGAVQKLQLPVWEQGEDYIFRAEVHYLVPPPPRSQQQSVSLFMNDGLVEKVDLRPGRQVMSFLIPAERLKQEEGFARIKLEHSNSKKYQGNDFALMYYWIEWKPSSVFLPELLGTKHSAPEKFPLISLNPTLQNVGMESQLQTPAGWGIETPGEGSFLWLGHGSAEGLGGMLWTAERRSVLLQAQVQPGPAREDRLRHMELELTHPAGKQIAKQAFDAPATLDFLVELLPGRNNFNLHALDEATVSKQPNGDTRPLLVRLDHISVEPITQKSKIKQAGPADHPLLQISAALPTISMESRLQTASGWGIEETGEGSLLWLGHDSAEGLGGTLWATEQQTILFQAQVQPGPARADSLRHMELELTSTSGKQVVKEEFETPTTLAFMVELQPGPNDFRLYVLDEATVFKQSNGDTRPLLVRLDHITLSPWHKNPKTKPAGTTEIR
jgi:hypothetical protein